MFRLDTYNLNQSTSMDQQQQEQAPSQPQPKPIPFPYLVETLLKVVFLVMSLFNLKYTLVVAFSASIFGLLRVLKRPQFNKEYLARVLTNNHGQNLLYISIGSLGFINYLYYAPIVLFFAYNIIEFVKIKFPASSFNAYGDVIRYNKFYVYEGKCKIELAFLAYCIVTLPFDLMGRLIKIFIMAQFLLVKYRLNNEFRYACTSVNNLIDDKTKSIGFLNNGYKKLAGWIHEYATRDPTQAQQQPQQQQ